MAQHHFSHERGCTPTRACCAHTLLMEKLVELACVDIRIQSADLVSHSLIQEQQQVTPILAANEGLQLLVASQRCAVQTSPHAGGV